MSQRTGETNQQNWKAGKKRNSIFRKHEQEKKENQYYTVDQEHFEVTL